MAEITRQVGGETREIGWRVRTWFRESFRFMLAQGGEGNYALGFLALIAAAGFGSGIYDALAVLLGAPQKWEAHIYAGLIPLGIFLIWMFVRIFRVRKRRGGLGSYLVRPRPALVAAPSRFAKTFGAPYEGYRSVVALKEDAQALVELGSAQVQPGAGERQADANTLGEHALAPDEVLRKVWDQVCVTTYGPLFLALHAHREELVSLHLVVTLGEGGTIHDYPHLKDALAVLYPRVQVNPIELRDASDAVAIAQTLDKEIHDILTSAPSEGRRFVASDLIVDFTGATAAYTAGANLAALDDYLALQYTSQRADIQLWKDDGSGGRDPEELVRLRKIVEVWTNHTLAPKLPADVRTTQL